LPSNERDKVVFTQPKTVEEREAVAAKCCAALRMSMPLLVDTIDDRVGHSYSGMPDRLYLIDKQGFVAYKGGRGPFGFKPGELEQALVMHMLDQEKKPPQVGSAALLNNAAAWARLPERESPAKDAELPAWARALSHAMPRSAAAMLELDFAHRVKSPLDPKLRAKVRWTAAHHNRSPFGEAIAVMDLRRANASEDEIERLTSGNSDESDLTLTFARKLTREAYKVTDEEFSRLKQIHGDANVVALVQLLAYSNYQDRLMHSLGLNSAEYAYSPLEVRFKKPWVGGGPVPTRALPKATLDVDRAPDARLSDFEWTKFDFKYLQAKVESQRGRQPRIAVPTFESVRRHLPPTFPKGRELKIIWSLVCLGYQPELATAWTLCTRTFGEESNQDHVFQELLFWVVTREQQCFY
jgi:alkylhydroperoxidase family enzyme